MLGELDMKDRQGNVVVSPGLKVRHKKSQYEYTVDNVIEDPDGEVNIILRMPEDPRFDPPPEEDVVISDDKDRGTMLYEIDPSGLYFPVPEEEVKDPDAPLQDDEFLAVPQDEFEKEYEVK